MHEARIEVTEEGENFRVRLLDMNNGGEQELASGLTPGTVLSQGIPEFRFDDTPLTASVLETKFRAATRLGNRVIFGTYLYRLLTPGNVGPEWEALYERTWAQNEILSTLLDLPPKGWQTLPWELVYHNKMHLCHDNRRAVGLRIPGGVAVPNRCSWPLKILVVLGCDPGDNIKWEQELLAIKRACCAFSLRFDLTVLPARKSKVEVENEIKKVSPHIFHFIGHATASGGGALLLNLGPNTNDRWQRDEIQAALTAQAPPRLAIINACESAGAEGVLGDSSTADAFATIGCPAVVAMRGDLLGTAAATFSRTFYEQLAEVGVNRLDQAYCRAVRAVSSTEGIDQRVWTIPRIYFQTRASDVFPLKGECRGFKEVSKHDPQLEEIKPFVDCQPQRFQLYQKSDAWLNDDDPANRLLLITGDEGMGKSWLLKALTYVASLRDFITFYWKFENNADIPRFLNAIRETGPQSSSCFRRSLSAANVDPTHFENFDRLYRSADSASRSGNEDRYSPVLAALADGLKTTAKTKSVLLAFDDIDKFDEPQWKNLIVPALIQPIVANRELAGKLRIVIAASEKEVSSHGLESLPAKPVKLNMLSPEQFEDLVLEFWLHHLGDSEADKTKLALAREALRTVAGIRPVPWKLSELPGIYSTFMGVS